MQHFQRARLVVPTGHVRRGAANVVGCIQICTQTLERRKDRVPTLPASHVAKGLTCVQGRV